jgi:hypothetical protein
VIENVQEIEAGDNTDCDVELGAPKAQVVATARHDGDVPNQVVAG